jgi:hypothetical protein
MNGAMVQRRIDPVKGVFGPGLFARAAVLDRHPVRPILEDRLPGATRRQKAH